MPRIVSGQKIEAFAAAKVITMFTDQSKKHLQTKAANRPHLNRRSLLGGAAAVLGSSMAGSAIAQVEGTGPGGATLPLRMPMGRLDFLDRKQYIHNMEIHAHLSGARGSGGEPLTSMLAKGRQRLLYGQGGFIDVSDARKPTVFNRGVLKGGGQANVVFNS